MRGPGLNPQGSLARRGFTMVELMVAAGLAAVLMVALFRLLDTALDMWTRGEDQRLIVERGAATAELLAEDLRSLHSGAQGDLLVDWVNFDVDQDGRVDRVWPRLRLVRSVSMADVVRLSARGVDPALVAQAAELGVDVETLIPEDQRPTPAIQSGLMEVAWAVVPVGTDALSRGQGLLMRGEALLAPGSVGKFFKSDFFSSSGRPKVGALEEVSAGLLWLGLQFATQTSIIWDGWNLGSGLEHSCASWDAWKRSSDDPLSPDWEAHPWNMAGAGMPALSGSPLLPRRVRVELEFERPADLRRRPTLLEPLEKQTASFEVSDGAGLPYKKGRHILIDGEWMEVQNLRGDRVSVKRAARGTAAMHHEIGARVHFGETVTVEVPVAMHSDDWNLGRSASSDRLGGGR